MEHFTRESSLWRNSDDMICYGCVGFFSYQVVDELADYVMAEICKADALHVPVAVVVYAPPIMDCIRITTRTVITHQHDKTFPFPAVDDLMQRLLTEKLGGRVNIVPTAEAKLKVRIMACGTFFISIRECFKVGKCSAVEQSLLLCHLLVLSPPPPPSFRYWNDIV